MQMQMQPSAGCHRHRCPTLPVPVPQRTTTAATAQTAPPTPRTVCDDCCAARGAVLGHQLIRLRLHHFQDALPPLQQVLQVGNPANQGRTGGWAGKQAGGQAGGWSGW